MLCFTADNVGTSQVNFGNTYILSLQAYQPTTIIIITIIIPVRTMSTLSILRGHGTGGPRDGSNKAPRGLLHKSHEHIPHPVLGDLLYVLHGCTGRHHWEYERYSMQCQLHQQTLLYGVHGVLLVCRSVSFVVSARREIAMSGLVLRNLRWSRVISRDETKLMSRDEKI